MSYKLFIDDERYPPMSQPDWMIVRNSSTAIKAVQEHGMPSFISFDHDLGGEDTTMVFLSWFEDQLIDGMLAFPENFNYYVHSQNPVGVNNIKGKMDSFIKHFKKG